MSSSGSIQQTLWSPQALPNPASAQPWPEGFDYRPAFIDELAGERCFASLCDTVQWQQPTVHLFGKSHKTPRLLAWHGDEGVRYRYSGIDHVASGWLAPLDDLRHRLQQEVNARFNSVLINYYRDGADSMGFHSDKEFELGDQPVIASVSLGHGRRFLLRPRTGGPSQAFWLHPGSLLVMHGHSQRDWQHALPKTAKPVGPRINLTFREIRQVS